jgi:hypothetical protein
MLKKLLFQHKNRIQFYAAAIGAIIGFLFLTTGIHYFLATRNMGEGQEILGSNIMIAQRKVSKFNALSLNNNTFNSQDIEKISTLQAIENVQPIVNNRFSVSLGMKEEGLPYFRTDIFVQSVDNTLMDVKVDNWKWEKGNKFIPLIMPRDFMLMLNQFAASYNIPQVSEELAMTFKFKLDVKGEKGRETFDAQIVGFSNQISAIVVPLDFMNYGNENYAKDEPEIITQLMISVHEGAFGDLEKIMDEMNLDIKKNELTIAKVKSVLSAVLSIILIVSLITIAMSALLIMQYAQLLLSKSDYEITTLLRIGYHPKTLALLFRRYFIEVFGILFIISSCCFIVIKFNLDRYLSSAGFGISTSFSSIPLLVLLFLIIGIVALIYFHIRKLFIQKIMLEN